MSIKKKPKHDTSNVESIAAENFLSGASKPAPVKKNKVPVALRFDPDLLAQIDALAARRGMSRNGIISYWCSRGVEAE